MFARDRAPIAHMCWTGGTVADKPCDPIERKQLPFAVTGMRVDVGKRDIGIELDATLNSALDGIVELSAVCVMPSGAPATDRARVWMTRKAETAITRKVRLFSRSRLGETPKQCTLALEIVDVATRTINEPLLTRCWRDGAVTDGACS